MSKIHFEVVESEYGLTIKSGSFVATTKVDDFKWYELSNLIGDFYLSLIVELISHYCEILRCVD